MSEVAFHWWCPHCQWTGPEPVESDKGWTCPSCKRAVAAVRSTARACPYAVPDVIYMTCPRKAHDLPGDPCVNCPEVTDA